MGIVQVQANSGDQLVQTLAGDFADLRDEVLGEVSAIREERDRLQLDASLASSGLPAAAQAVIRRVAEPLLGGVDFAELQELIELQRGALAAAVQPTVVSGMRPITAHGPYSVRDMRTGADDLQEAMDWCLGVRAGRCRRRRCAMCVTCTWRLRATSTSTACSTVSVRSWRPPRRPPCRRWPRTA